MSRVSPAWIAKWKAFPKRFSNDQCRAARRRVPPRRWGNGLAGRAGSPTACRPAQRPNGNPRREARRYGSSEVSELMRDLMPVVDNLERAYLAARHTGDAEALTEAVGRVREQFVDVLVEHARRLNLPASSQSQRSHLIVPEPTPWVG